MATIYAVALCRVSSLEQLLNRSLEHQRNNVVKAAEKLGVVLPEDGIWQGQASSKVGVNINRRDLKEIYDYCKKKPSVKYLIVQEVDRFMRSPEEQVYFQVKFKTELGVQIYYADKPELNEDTLHSGLLRYLDGFRAAGSNEERKNKSIGGHKSAVLEGRYTAHPKPGYVKGVIAGVHQVHPVKGSILKGILEKIALGTVTPTNGLKELNISKFVEGRANYKMDKFRKIITDPYYAGIIEVDKQVKARNEHGRHEALITKDVHEELVHIMNNREKNQSGPRKNGNPKYILSNIVSCALCTDKSNGRYVGYDHGNGTKNGKVYCKYRCRGCSRYLSREELHAKVTSHLNDIYIPEEDVNLLIKELRGVWASEESKTRTELIQLSMQIGNLKNRIGTQIDDFSNPENAGIKDEISNRIKENKGLLSILEDNHRTLEDSIQLDRESFMQFALDFVNHPGDEFFSMTKEDILLCKLLVFPSGFYLDKNNKVYTPEISPIYRLKTSKRDTEVSQKSLVVRVRRL